MFREINKRFKNAILMIAKRTEESVEFLGTGFIVSSYGHVLTCAHILNPTDKLVAIAANDNDSFSPITLERVTALDLTLVQLDGIHDVALLKINNYPFLPVPNEIFGDATSVNSGAQIAILGFPFGQNRLHSLSITHGIVSSKVMAADDLKLFQFDCMIHEGNSGSPLIELRTNKIIGVVSSRFNPTPSNVRMMLGNRMIGVDTNISYAAIIDYGKALLENEIKK
ncbi:S1 family peptidase [Pontibacter sp. H249]|uniref:S1 family peptidase n=1 Tax=Pontibacter sp. H249 TaxID=3133420 RepID=UPI0030BD2FAA